jgi:hypothetical protein
MNIETIYRARISWEARDYDTQTKIEDKASSRIYVAQKVEPTLECICFSGNVACSPYFTFTHHNRKIVEDIYKTISKIIMAHKGSKIE